jgi:A/G-specific adenine glycosylase
MWTDGLPRWFGEHGRHHLPWRLTTDPWAVLVSEVMLQQTSVSRVLPRWHGFLQRWPTAAACADASLDEVLREWRGLGYPRRARALWLTAGIVATAGWPDGEAGLRALPGVGSYTARALLAFSDAGIAAPSRPPRDVNLGRVAARAALGVEPHQVTPAALDTVLASGRPRAMPMRQYSYALFDVGALHCRAAPRCDGCPLSRRCAFRAAGAPVAAAPRRQPPYRGSLRQLRGTILAAALSGGSLEPEQLAAALARVPAVSRERVDEALAGLANDGLLPGAAGRGAAATGRTLRRDGVAPTATPTTRPARGSLRARRSAER